MMMVMLILLFLFFQGPEFRDFVLTKLINAELACYRANQFAKLGVSFCLFFINALSRNQYIVINYASGMELVAFCER